MAENKKSFVLYADLLHTVSKLPDDKAGQLFKHILSYVNDLDPVSDDLILNIAFEPIKQQLKRDLKAWEVAIETKSKGGRLGNLKRWNTDLYTKVINDKMTLEEAEEIAKHRIASDTDKKHRIPSDSIASVAVNVNDNVTVNDTVTVTDNVIHKDIPSLDVFIENAKVVCKANNIPFIEYEFAIKSKYQTWVDNGWKDGFNKPIKNWKNKFNNTLPNLKPIKNNAPNTPQTAGLRPLLNQLKP